MIDSIIPTMKSVCKEEIRLVYWFRIQSISYDSYFHEKTRCEAQLASRRFGT